MIYYWHRVAMVTERHFTASPSYNEQIFLWILVLCIGNQHDKAAYSQVYVGDDKWT